MNVYIDTFVSISFLHARTEVYFVFAADGGPLRLNLSASVTFVCTYVRFTLQFCCNMNEYVRMIGCCLRSSYIPAPVLLTSCDGQTLTDRVTVKCQSVFDILLHGFWVHCAMHSILLFRSIDETITYKVFNDFLPLLRSVQTDDLCENDHYHCDWSSFLIEKAYLLDSAAFQATRLNLAWLLNQTKPLHQKVRHLLLIS
jgi:hypothetical protein